MTYLEMLTRIMCAVLPVVEVHALESQGTCGENYGTCLLGSLSRGCFCDEVCANFDDCCADSRPPVYDGELNQLDIGGTFQCLRILDGASIYVINRCPNKLGSPALRNKCEEDFVEQDVLSKVAVSDFHTGVTFKNIYCAACHGRDAHQVVYWDFDVQCTWPKDENPLFQLDAEGRGNRESLRLVFNVTRSSIDWRFCSSAVLPPRIGEPPRECIHSITHCHSEWTDQGVSDLCSSHTSYVYDIFSSPKVAYRNKFCAICNFVEQAYLQCAPQAEASGIYGDLGTLPPVGQSPPALSMRILLDLNQGEISQYAWSPDGSVLQDDTSIDMGSKCPSNAVLDVFQDTCRSVFCPDGYDLNEKDECEENSEKVTNETLSNDLHNTTCPIVLLHPSEYERLLNGSIHVIPLNKVITNESYWLLRNDSLGICVEAFPIPEQMSEYRTKFTAKSYLVEAYMSVVGYTLSLIALVILLAIYTVVPSLRNLPGKCMMCLAGSLFCAQALFLFLDVPESSTWPCLLMAVLCHYSYLATFFWKNILAFDIWRTFHFNRLRMRRCKNHVTSKRFVFYSLYAWVAPFLIVTLALLIDQIIISVSHEYRPDYGSYHCWINSVQGLLWFFAAPLAVTLIINMVFFSLTVWSICRTDKSTKSATEGKTGGLSRKTCLLLYIKLSLIMGFTWVFGFLANITAESAVLWYLFIVFGSLQGLFICIAFGFNREVLHLLKERVFGAEKRSNSGRRLFSKASTKTKRLSDGSDGISTETDTDYIKY